MIVGTAGHVDHGKTTLVHALTGVDTDRLKEEKARGISIDLGYAYQTVPGGATLGFVDVPGHERFVHTMLAGAAGIDYALLVVAADDGVMPQTREHVQVLDLLGVARGAIAVTKIDRVDPRRVAAVTDEACALLKGTALARCPAFSLSAVTGAGVAALREHLQAVALQTPGARTDGRFRLTVDRSFTLDGAGTVVTGTVIAGSVSTGDSLVVSPRGASVRVRGIHAHHRAATRAAAGERCALNLAGVRKDEVARGDWVVAEALHAPTDRIDVRLIPLRDAPDAIGEHTPVHVHIGAAHVMGRVDRLEPRAQTAATGDKAAATLPASANPLAQIVLERPIAALFGDRCILRDASATRTIGGAIVIDPFAPARRRGTPERLAHLHALETPDHEAALARLLALEPLGVDLARLCRARNLDAGSIALPAGGVRVRTIGPAGATAFAFDRTHWARLQTHVLGTLARFHVGAPDEVGPDGARLRRIAIAQLAPAAASALVEALIEDGKIRRSGPWLHLPGHDAILGPTEQQLATQALPLIAAAGFDPPWVRDLARNLGADEGALRRALLGLTRRGELYQVVRDLFFAKDAVAELARIAAELESSEGAVRAAAFRDRSAIGRKRSVQILEFFDRIGFTRRIRDEHRLHSNSLLCMGEAATRGMASRAPAVPAL
jgi:selenocysteine-specific elongation factor